MFYPILKCESCPTCCCNNKGDSYYRFMDKEKLMDDIFKSMDSGIFDGNTIWKYSPDKNDKHKNCVFFKDGACTYVAGANGLRMPICDTYPFYLDSYGQLVLSMKCPSYKKVIEILEDSCKREEALGFFREVREYLSTYRKDHVDYMKEIVGNYDYMLVIRC